MVTTNLNLSMNNPEVVQIHAKQGDSGRIYKINLKDATEENGTLRILRPDGVEVTADAIKSASGDAYKGELVTFDALEEVPLTKCEVTLEPMQDLHGYDYPWPSGGGKNVLPFIGRTDSSATGPTISYSDADQCYIINGTVAQQGNMILSYIPNTDLKWTIGTKYSISVTQIGGSMTLASGTGITFAIGIFDSSASTFVRGETGASSLTNYKGQGNAFTSTGDFRILFQVWRVGTVFDNLKLRIQIEEGTTAQVTDWSPYSNICPIEPSNGVNLYSGTQSISLGGENARTLDVNIATVPQGSYYVSSVNGGTATTAQWGMQFFNSSNQNVGNIGGGNGTLTLSGDAVRIYFYIGSTYYEQGKTVELSNIQIEQGTVATPYVLYQGINVYQRGYNLCPLPRSANAIKYNGSGLTTTDLDNGISVKGQSSGSSHAVGFILFYADDYLNKKLTLSATMSGSNSSPQATLFLCDSAFGNRSVLGLLAQSGSVTITVPSTASGKFIGLALASTTGADSESAVSTYTNIQLEEGETATPYQPYNSTTYPLSLGQNVYGGTLDVVSGKLTVTHVLMTDFSTVAMSTGSTQGGGNYRIRIKPDNIKTFPETSLGNIKCNLLPTITESATYGRTVGISNSHNDNEFFIYLPELNTVNEYRSWLTTNGAEVCYELATPIEVDLTPTQITTLLGTNNIWSSGEVEVAFEYDGLLAQLPQQATAVVGRCIGDVNFTNVSTMPFTLNVIPNNQEETP